MRVFVATLALLVSNLVFGADVKLSVLGVYNSKHGDGFWYQSGYGPYTLDTSSPGVSISVSGATPLSWLKWEAGYDYLGKHSTECVCVSSDVAYEELLRGNDVGWPPSKFYTKGDTHGAHVSILPQLKMSGVTVFGKLGVGYYGTSNRVRVLDWRPATDQSYLKWGDAQELNVSNSRKWFLTPVFGVGVRVGNTELAVTTIKVNVKGGLDPIIHGRSYIASISYVF